MNYKDQREHCVIKNVKSCALRHRW